MIIKSKYFLVIYFLFHIKNLFCYEIIRDPIFENYFFSISEELKLKNVNTYLVRDKSANAFVINNNIYFTTGLLNSINQEDTLKAIYLHEYGHIINKHFLAKKIKIQESKNKSAFFGLFSVGLAVLTTNTNLGIGTSITLNTRLVEEISRHSVNFEIEADSFMINQIKKNKINTEELISFLNQVENPKNKYFRTHPKSEDRINNLKEFNYNKSNNSEIFNWIKSKYSSKSINEDFNIFFINLESGIFEQNKKINEIDKALIEYEAFKKGLLVNDWYMNFQNLLKINKNSFLRIEYINYILDNNLEDKYYIIDNLKFDKNIMNEYFYYYIYGKYYNKLGLDSLSNFYFCQFYRTINSDNKADFFCKKYDIKDIPTLDKSYALFK